MRKKKTKELLFGERLIAVNRRCLLGEVSVDNSKTYHRGKAQFAQVSSAEVDILPTCTMQTPAREEQIRQRIA